MGGIVIKYLLCSAFSGMVENDERWCFLGIVIRNVDLCNCKLVKLVGGFVVIC